MGEGAGASRWDSPNQQSTAMRLARGVLWLRNPFGRSLTIEVPSTSMSSIYLYDN